MLKNINELFIIIIIVVIIKAKLHFFNIVCRWSKIPFILIFRRLFSLLLEEINFNRLF